MLQVQNKFSRKEELRPYRTCTGDHFEQKKPIANEKTNKFLQKPCIYLIASSQQAAFSCSLIFKKNKLCKCRNKILASDVMYFCRKTGLSQLVKLGTKLGMRQVMGTPFAYLFKVKKTKEFHAEKVLVCSPKKSPQIMKTEDVV